MAAAFRRTLFCILSLLGLLGTTQAQDKLDLTFVVPPYARLGGEARLECRYDSGGDPVMSVKWYKNFKEFYRYTPKEMPPVKTFAAPGINIDTKRSNGSVVILKPVTYSTRGAYVCEVTKDTDGFLTHLESASLDVIAFPDSGPVITLLKPTYNIGDIVEANCTSYRSKTPVNLTWYFHSEEFPRNSVEPSHHGFKAKPHANDSTSLYLKFTLRPEMLRHGRLTLRCVARIHNVYEKFAEKTIQEADNPKLSSVVDNSSSSSSSYGGNIIVSGGSPCHVVPSLFVSLFLLVSRQIFAPDAVSGRGHESR